MQAPSRGNTWGPVQRRRECGTLTERTLDNIDFIANEFTREIIYERDEVKGTETFEE